MGIGEADIILHPFVTSSIPISKENKISLKPVFIDIITLLPDNNLITYWEKTEKNTITPPTVTILITALYIDELKISLK